MNDEPRVGAFVLDTLTTGMYTNPLDSLREYVQNASDSIHKAEDKGTLRPREGRIEIWLDPDERLVRIRDNGAGIPEADAASRLLDIGISDKRADSEAGFRGIGRLAGIAYCNELEFRTSAKGESTETTVCLDCQGLKDAMSPSRREVEELAQVMRRCSELRSGEAAKGDHYFVVEMRGVSPTASNFLCHDEVERHLQQVAPLDFDPNRFVFAPVISEWTKQHKLVMPAVTMVIRTPTINRQVFKPYRGHYHTHDREQSDYRVDVKDIVFVPDAPSADAPFWIWYAKTDLVGMVADECVAGLRLRKNNIGIGGPERVAEYFTRVAKSYTRINAYYIGEIHILTSKAIPNARRDGFESLGAWPDIERDLVEFAKERSKAVYELSDARNRPTVKVVTQGTRVLQEIQQQVSAGLVSSKQRDDLIAKAQKEEEKASQALSTRPDTEDARQIDPLITEFRELRGKLETENHFVTLPPTLGRKERKVVATILEALHDALAPQEFERARDAILRRLKVTEQQLR